jgi:hypothetical protein
MAQQTAAALLREHLDAEMKMGTKMVINWDMYLQMEKEQITDSYIMGSYDMAAKEFRPEQYYNEQYGQGSPDTSSPNTQNK